jgi:hypothetical protein
VGEFLACAVCGDRIGVYERFFVIRPDGSVMETSRASDPSIRESGEICIHRSCDPDGALSRQRARSGIDRDLAPPL